MLFVLLALPAPRAIDPLTTGAVRPDPDIAAEVSAVAERVDAQRRLLLGASGPGAPAFEVDVGEHGGQRRRALQASWVSFAAQSHGNASAPGADSGARATVPNVSQLHGPAPEGASQGTSGVDLGYKHLPASRRLQQAALKRLRDNAAEQAQVEGAGHDQVT